MTNGPGIGSLPWQLRKGTRENSEEDLYFLAELTNAYKRIVISPETLSAEQRDELTALLDPLQHWQHPTIQTLVKLACDPLSELVISDADPLAHYRQVLWSQLMVLREPGCRQLMLSGDLTAEEILEKSDRSIRLKKLFPLIEAGYLSAEQINLCPEEYLWVLMYVIGIPLADDQQASIQSLAEPFIANDTEPEALSTLHEYTLEKMESLQTQSSFTQMVAKGLISRGQVLAYLISSHFIGNPPGYINARLHNNFSSPVIQCLIIGEKITVEEAFCLTPADLKRIEALWCLESIRHLLKTKAFGYREIIRFSEKQTKLLIQYDWILLDNKSMNYWALMQNISNSALVDNLPIAAKQKLANWAEKLAESERALLNDLPQEKLTTTIIRLLIGGYLIPAEVLLLDQQNIDLLEQQANQWPFNKKLSTSDISTLKPFQLEDNQALTSAVHQKLKLYYPDQFELGQFWAVILREKLAQQLNANPELKKSYPDVAIRANLEASRKLARQQVISSQTILQLSPEALQRLNQLPSALFLSHSDSPLLQQLLQLTQPEFDQITKGPLKSLRLILLSQGISSDELLRCSKNITQINIQTKQAAMINALFACQFQWSKVYEPEKSKIQAWLGIQPNRAQIWTLVDAKIITKDEFQLLDEAKAEKCFNLFHFKYGTTIYHSQQLLQMRDWIAQGRFLASEVAQLTKEQIECFVQFILDNKSELGLDKTRLFAQNFFDPSFQNIISQDKSLIMPFLTRDPATCHLENLQNLQLRKLLYEAPLATKKVLFEQIIMLEPKQLEHIDWNSVWENRETISNKFAAANNNDESKTIASKTTLMTLLQQHVKPTETKISVPSEPSLTRVAISHYPTPDYEIMRKFQQYNHLLWTTVKTAVNLFVHFAKTLMVLAGCYKAPNDLSEEIELIPRRSLVSS